MTDLAKKLSAATKGDGVPVGARTEATFRKKTMDTRKFTFNIDESIYQRLRKQAYEQERDMTGIVNEILEKHFF